PLRAKYSRRAWEATAERSSHRLSARSGGTQDRHRPPGYWCCRELPGQSHRAAATLLRKHGPRPRGAGMNPLWSERLRDAWQELASHSAQTRAYRTRRLSEQLQLDAYAALRAVDGAPCLIIEGIAPAEHHFEVGDMRLGVVRDERGPLLVLSLEDRDRIDLFTTVCADAISASEESDRTLVVFLDRLDAWRRFLRERNSGLSREEATGMIGELLVLRELLSRDRTALGLWEAPEDGLHDFHREGHALEVKASLGPSSQVRISTLDQLDIIGLRRLDL